MIPKRPKLQIRGPSSYSNLNFSFSSRSTPYFLGDVQQLCGKRLAKLVCHDDLARMDDTWSCGELHSGAVRLLQVPGQAQAESCSERGGAMGHMADERPDMTEEAKTWLRDRSLPGFATVCVFRWV